MLKCLMLLNTLLIIFAFKFRRTRQKIKNLDLIDIGVSLKTYQNQNLFVQQLNNFS